MTWYSAMLRFLITIDGTLDRRSRSLIVLRARDRDSAFAGALARGQLMEQDYVNGFGERVCWRLELVETIDQLDDELDDGREVYAEPWPPPESSVRENADPSTFPPGTSGV